MMFEDSFIAGEPSNPVSYRPALQVPNFMVSVMPGSGVYK